MTDRAPVNHCVVVQLQDIFNVPILELNCNVHPLDALATAARKVLSSFDQESNFKGAVLGKCGSAANVIMAISKLRFKQGVGDPAGFKSFFQRNGVPIGLFTRYVGNRLHVLFHLAGVIISQRDLLMSYLQDYCSSGTLCAAF